MASTSVRSEDSSASEASILKALQDLLQREVDGGIPGISAAIGTRDNITWQVCAGLSDFRTKEPINPNHIFGIGSISKVFVNVVILQLVEEGRLNLDDTLGALLDPTVLTGIENAAPATLANLLAHTSGIEDPEKLQSWISDARGRNIKLFRIWGRADTLEYIRKPVSQEQQLPSSKEPASTGEFKHSYSNANFILLGLVIEKITGSLAEDEIRRRILTPLQLHSTYLEGFEPPLKDKLALRFHYVTPTYREHAGIQSDYTEVLIDVTASNLSVEWVAGGMISNPQDLVKFARALRDGKLLNAASLQRMQQWQPASELSSIGLCIFHREIDGTAFCGHNGSVLGYTGALWWASEGDCVLAVVANIGNIHCGDGVRGAADVALSPDFLKLALQLCSTKDATIQ